MRIIRFKNPNLRFFEGEGDAVGGGGPVDSGDTQSAPDNSQGGGTGHNPNWDQLLNLIPGQLHDGVKPILSQWDKNYETRLSEVQSQLEPLKQWERFSGIEPDDMARALQFYQIAEQDPMRLLQQLQEFYGQGDSGQGQQGQADNEGQEPEFDLNGDDILQHPKVQELLQNQEVLAQYLLTQRQQEEQRELESQIEAEHKQIVEANPDFSEDDLVHMYEIATARNISLTDAAGIVKGYMDNVAQRRQAPPAPSVLPGTNGVVPAANSVDPTKLNGNDRRKLVAEILTQSREG